MDVAALSSTGLMAQVRRLYQAMHPAAEVLELLRSRPQHCTWEGVWSLASGLSTSV
jgi:hypothetical protein